MFFKLGWISFSLFSLIFLLDKTMASEVDFSLSLMEQASQITPINQNDLEKKFKKYVKDSRKSLPLLAVGESHHYMQYYHSLTGPILKRFSQQHEGKVRLCSEKISQFFESTLFQDLKENLFPRVFIAEMSPWETNLTNCIIEPKNNEISAYIFYSGFHHQMPLQLLFPNSFFQSTPVSSTLEHSSVSYFNSQKAFFIQGMELGHLFQEKVNQILKAVYDESQNYADNHLSLVDIFANALNISQLEAQLFPNSKKKIEFYYGHFDFSPILKTRATELSFTHWPEFFNVLLINPLPLQNKISSLLKFLISQEEEWQKNFVAILKKEKVYYGQNLMGEGSAKAITHGKTLEKDWECHYSNLPEKISCYAQSLTFKINDINYLIIHDPETLKTKCYQNTVEKAFLDCLPGLQEEPIETLSLIQ